MNGTNRREAAKKAAAPGHARRLRRVRHVAEHDATQADPLRSLSRWTKGFPGSDPARLKRMSSAIRVRKAAARRKTTWLSSYSPARPLPGILRRRHVAAEQAR